MKLNLNRQIFETWNLDRAYLKSQIKNIAKICENLSAEYDFT